MVYPGFYTGEDVSINDVPLNRVDVAGCKWLLEDLDGWWGLPEPNVPDDTRAFSEDGSYYAPGRYEARQITAKGRIVPPPGITGPRAAAVARNTLNQAMNLVRKTAVLAVRDGSVLVFNYDTTNPSNAISQSVGEVTQIANVQLIGRPLTRFDTMNNVLEFNFQLRAADPRKYASSASQRTTPLLANSTGRRYNRAFPYSYGGDSGNDGLMTVVNSGSYDTFGTLRFNGPVVNPTIEHVQLGKTLSFDLTIGTDEYVDVNLRNRTVYFNSTASRRGALRPSSQWFWITPGVNTLRYTGTQTIPARPEYLAATNLATNPSFEMPFGTALSLSNLVPTPRPSTSTTGFTYSGGSGEAGITVAAGQDPEPTGVLVRTNYARNPQPRVSTSMFGTYSAGTGEGGASVMIASVDPELEFDSPVPEITSYARRIVTAPKTAGSTGWQGRSSTLSSPVTGSVGDKFAVSLWARYNAPEGTEETAPEYTTSVRMRMVYQATAGTDTQSVDADTITLTSGEWTRVFVTGAATTNFVAVGWWLYQIGSDVLPANSTFDVAGLLIERETGTVESTRPYFDGSVNELISEPDNLFKHAWTGTADASTSTQTQTVIPEASGMTGLIGYIRRIVSVPGSAGSRSLTYESPAGVIAGSSGQVRNISVYVRPSVALPAQLTGHTVSGTTLLGTTVGTSTTLPAGQWTRLDVAVTPTGAFDRVRAVLSFSTALPAGATLDMTNIQVTSGAALFPYFDGDYAPVQYLEGTTAWTGTPDNSPSTLSVPGVKTLGPTSSSMTASSSVIAYRSSIWSFSGSYSLGTNMTNATNSNTIVYPTGNAAATGLTRLNMQPGSTYAVSVYMYLPEAQTGTLNAAARTIALDIVQPSGTTTNFAQSQQAPNEPGVYRLSFVVDIPADATGGVLKFINGSQNTQMFWDALMIEPGNEVSADYMDGSSPWASWDNGVDNSISERPYVEGIPESVVQLSYRSAWIE